MTSPMHAVSRGGWRRTAEDLRRRWRPIVAYQLLTSVLASLVVTPLATLTLRAILRSTGTVAINNYDLVGFFLSPVGIAYLAAALALALTLFFLLQAGLVLLTARQVERRDPLATLRCVVRKLPVLVPLGLRQLGGLLLALLPFAAMIAAALVPLLRLHDVNYYLHESPPEWRRALVLAGAAAAGFLAVATWLAARWSLSVPAVMLDAANPRSSMRESWRRTRGHAWRIVRLLGGWWLLLLVANLLVVNVVRLLARPLVMAAGERVGLVFLLVAAVVALVLLSGFVWLLAGHAGHATLVNAVYHAAGGEEREAALEPVAPGHTPLSAGTVALAALATYALTLAVGAWRLNRVHIRDDVQVTGHRGSGSAPENSLAAIRQAIDARADWVEIDVQRTADGSVIVLHDGDLMRLAGDPRKVAEVTLADLEQVDIGSRKDARFAGERVPTLQQVLDLARGRLKVNIELKYNRPDSLLVPAVLGMVRDNGMVDQVSITSLDYAALADVEQRAPEFRTGMIVTKAVGVPARLPVDFLSVNQSAVDRKLLARARVQHKEVHAWTVNARDDMVRMMELGVDNLITDDPGEAVAVRSERAGMSPTAKLALRLRRILVE